MSEPTPLKHGTGMFIITLNIRGESYETPFYFDTENSKEEMEMVCKDAFEGFWKNFQEVK